MLQDDLEQIRYLPKNSQKYFCDKINLDDVVVDDDNLNPIDLEHKLPLTNRFSKHKNNFFNLEMKKIIKQEKIENDSEKLSNELKQLMQSCGINQNYSYRDINRTKAKIKKLTPFQVIIKENEAFKEIIKLKKIKNNSPSNLHYTIKTREIFYSSGNDNQKKNQFNLRNFVSKKKCENKKCFSHRKNTTSGYIYKNENNIKQKIFNSSELNKTSLLKIFHEKNSIFKKGIIKKIKKKITKDTNINYLNDKGEVNNTNNNNAKYFVMKNFCNSYKLPFINKDNNTINNIYNNNKYNGIFSIEKKDYNKTFKNIANYDKNIMKKANNNINNGFSTEKNQTINFAVNNYNKSAKNLYLSNAI